jgi:diguanylate cyclase (GGDEF)-like protein
MLDLVASVAEMTGLRNRDEVGQSICGLLFDLIAPRELIFWHLASLDGVPCILKSLHLTRDKQSGGVVSLPSEAAVPVEACPTLRACIDRKRLQTALGATGELDQFFPVIGKRGVLGVLEVRSGGVAQDEQTALVERLLQIYRNHVELLDYGELDGLTGLMNRKAFDDHFIDVIEEQRRLSAQSGVQGVECVSWLAVIDIDHFKSVNDRFGHLLGDEVLALAARLMQQSFRHADRLFRCGGEEFAVMLHNLTQDEAEASLQRYRRRFAEFHFPQVGHVTVSVGYSRLSLTDNLPSAFGRADRALYFSKQNGRNAVHCYETLLDDARLTASPVELNDVELF